MATDSGGRVISPGVVNSESMDYYMDSTPVLSNDQSIVDSGHLNETCRQYSPKNSDFVRVFTEIGTPSQQKVNNVHNENELTFSQPSHEADYIPQQEFIAKLDHDLLDLPKEPYMLKLIELTSNSDDCLTWYRSTLVSRAKSLQGCPTGKLFTRKSTTKSSSTSKYARDCYILYMFLQGDKTQIDEVFRKDDNRVTITDQSSESVNIEMIEMRTNIHVLMERVAQLEKTEQINDKTIKVLQAENNKLRLHVSEMKEQLNTHSSEWNRNSTK